MSNDARNFLETDKALCYIALERDPGLILRAAEMIRDACHKAPLPPEDPRQS